MSTNGQGESNKILTRIPTVIIEKTSCPNCGDTIEINAIASYLGEGVVGIASVNWYKLLYPIACPKCNEKIEDFYIYVDKNYLPK